MAEEEATADYILKHRRLRWWSAGVEEQDTDVVSPSPKEIEKAAAARFCKACDSNVWKRLNSVLLEPANPFEPKAPRRLRREAVVLGSMILIFLLLVLYFNCVVDEQGAQCASFSCAVERGTYGSVSTQITD